jgi:hypothetical protein
MWGPALDWRWGGDNVVNGVNVINVAEEHGIGAKP